MRAIERHPLPEGAPTFGFDEAAGLVDVVSGRLDSDRLTLFGIVRDEMFFLPAFLDHYRKIGVEQFALVDDLSVDGTGEFLRAQADCVVLRAAVRYGDPVGYRRPDGRLLSTRGGVYLKAALPHGLMPGRCVLYADADEFLLLPPGIGHLRQVVERMEREGALAVAASLVEMYPAELGDMKGASGFGSLSDLVAAAPYFDRSALVEVDGRSAARLVGPSKSTRLFERHGLRARRPGLKGWFWERLPARKTPRHKTPLLFRVPGAYLVDSHDTNVPPAGTMLLAMMHFVFTAQFAEKVARARTWRSHTGGADKYDVYAALIERMERSGGAFLDELSARFESAEQFMDCGLMRW